MFKEQFDSTTDLAGEILISIEGEGFSKDEIVRALATAIVLEADGDEDLLDEAANILADN
jgi:hypothetical protein